MGNLAYMIRGDWAQQAKAMVPQSKVIRDWVGVEPYFFAVPDTKSYKTQDRNLEREAADFIAGPGSERNVFSIADFGDLGDTDTVVEPTVIVLHPRDRKDVEVLRKLIENGTLARVFVLVWWHADEVLTWLDAHGALNLHTKKAAALPDPLMVEAASMMVEEEYNGLSSGSGKNAVVQLVRAFASNGYRPDEREWVRAYFAAGGNFRNAEVVGTLVREIRQGKRHRVHQQYVDNIFEVVSARVASESGS